MTLTRLRYASLDEVIEAMYRSISGPAGAARDWEAFGDALLPGAPLVPLSAPAGGAVRPLSYGEYRRTREPLFRTNGFYEFETERVTELRGPLAQVYSWFTARKEPEGPDVLRGVNAIQLVRSGDRWWIVSLAWYREFDETEAHGLVVEGTH